MRPLIPLAVIFLATLALFDRLPVSFLHPQLTRASEALLGEKTLHEGVVIEPVQVRGQGSRVLLSFEEEKILLNLGFIPDWETGDRVQFRARLKRPVHYQNEGSFDYRRFLQRQDILLTGFVAEPSAARLLEKRKRLMHGVEHLRKRIVSTLHQNLPETEAGFLAALMVGDRSGMKEELWDRFRRTGTAHLVAISGQHVAIVCLFFLSLFFWLLKRSEQILLRISARKLAAALALLPATFYTVLAGSPPSALRALILACLVVLAILVRREIDPLSALAAAAIGISLFDPSAPFSASFQLSFLAVLGMILFSRKEHPYVWWQRYLLFPLQMSFAATLLTAPLVARLFHQVSLSGLLTNLWAIPFVGALLVVTALALILSFFMPPLGVIPLKACGFACHFFLQGIEVSSRTSWVLTAYPTGWDLAVSYGLMGLLVLIWHRPGLWRRACSVGILLLALNFSLPFLFRSEHLEVTFLDVGQGDAALIVTPSKKVLLVDGGGFLITGQGPPDFDVGQEVIVPYLKYRGIRKIDRILLSHPHPDHYGGLGAVVENFSVGEFWSNGQDFPDPTFGDLISNIRERGIPEKILRRGDRIEWEGLVFDVLYPDRIDDKRNINDNSLVVSLRYGEARILFSGDIEKKGEATLAEAPEEEKRKALRATILKIPHHASKTSSSIPFIDEVHPLYAVASLSDRNTFGFPHPGVLQKYERRGVKVYRIDRDGAVTFKIGPDFPKSRIQVRTVSSGRSQ